VDRNPAHIARFQTYKYISLPGKNPNFFISQFSRKYTNEGKPLFVRR
jgi:hypothetical protein